MQNPQPILVLQNASKRDQGKRAQNANIHVVFLTFFSFFIVLFVYYVGCQNSG
jgi:hypothetical protein